MKIEQTPQVYELDSSIQTTAFSLSVSTNRAKSNHPRQLHHCYQYNFKKGASLRSYTACVEEEPSE